MNGEEAQKLRRRFRTNCNAPNVGEFNNAKVTPFIEPDPTQERKFKNGLIVIDTTTRHKRGNHRNYFHMNTKYDNRNCSAWHVKNVQKFSLAAIIATGDEMSEVETLDELNLVDKNGTALTQQYLVDHLGYLNGETMIGGFTSTTTLHRVNQGQKAVTKNQEKLDFLGSQDCSFLR